MSIYETVFFHRTAGANPFNITIHHIHQCVAMLLMVARASSCPSYVKCATSPLGVTSDGFHVSGQSLEWDFFKRLMNNVMWLYHESICKQ